MKEDPPQPDPELAYVLKLLTGGWGISIGVIVLLVAMFYVEEDWRGAADWKQAQADVIAKGESLDPAKFIPAPVPDEQNFAKEPIFEMARSSSSYPQDVGMQRAFANLGTKGIPYAKDESLLPGDLPYIGMWRKGEMPDAIAIRKQLAGCVQLRLKEVEVAPDASATEMFGLLVPEFANLRAANEAHPLCRFDFDHTTMPPFSRMFGALTHQIKLAQYLSYEERLAIRDHQPALAADDLKIGWKVASGLQQEPTLVAGLVCNGVVAIQLGVVEEGLAKHVWDDQQLSDLENDLGKIDFLAETQSCVRGEMAVESVPNFTYIKAHRLDLREAMTGPRVGPGMAPTTLESMFFELLITSIVEAIPNGWFDDFEAAEIRFNLLGVVQMVDPAVHRAYPERERAATAAIATSRVVNFPVLSNLIHFALPYVKRFAYGQSLVDEARIACRLERYRLAYGQYPAALADLRTIPGGELPNDVMTGNPYRYKVQPDGIYLLYSVGWNQTDEGGDRNLPRYMSTSDADDWIWYNVPVPTPK